ncbi:MAG TPA: 16S rRNA (cytidine(1402)-2'-O)-methyltransferase [Candidatus Scatavimonas merdigallinarum]|uniref:Ribosomal RNA small subunit methyltransferase I n=1 Tax=Candidatus Scatavimonas merdigallinarum TaxID=2840914 RepID=A0A9D0ZJ61_9FIRM|nr:16S rRNA (cytidine(1402)-2'-O)-methyltransferase [Candidatus Scatavimonas merdigallinarum]
MAGTLYVVGTPIGNLGDLSPRALQTLRDVDFIAAEDTRVTLKLLNHFSIKKPLISYFEHNKLQRGDVICTRIESGENCALVTDAGMPAISDPGEDLVRQCAQRGIQAIVVPGPSAVVSALALSALPTGRFTFEGFLSMNKKNRREHLAQLKEETRTMVFYEAPHKLSHTLADLYQTFGDRRLSIVRELTKVHEQVIRTTLKDAVQRYAQDPLKGELVLIIEGKPQERPQPCPFDQALLLAQEYTQQGMSTSEAAKTAAKFTGLKKGDLYKALQNGKQP